VTRALREVGYLARRAWQLEVGVWASLWRFIFRRPRVPAGATAIAYHGPVFTILIVFIVLSAVEIPIIDLIVYPWPWVRIPFLALGIWGLTWMLGFLFGFLTRPHSVGPDGLRIRQGADLEVVVPWAAVEAIRMRTETAEARSPKLTEGRTPGAATLHVRVANETNLLIELDEPMTVRMPRGEVRVDTIRCRADDPRAFLDASRPHLVPA